MRVLKVIVGLSLLLTASACAVYGPGYRPYYYGHPHYAYYRY